MRTATRRVPLFACLAFALAACNLPLHEARARQEFRVPAEGLRTLACTTHNGDVVVDATDGDQVVVTADLSVRGDTEAEARANLERLRVVREVRDGRLDLRGEADPDLGWDCSPSFAFTITAPAALATELVSHNGGITVRGVRAPINAQSHNGSLHVDAAADRLQLVTHNGSVHVDVRGQGRLDGKIESHNGNVTVAVAAGRSAAIAATTHNGNLHGGDGLHDVRVGDGSLTGKVGDGQGSLEVVTHNGNVVFR